jgi:hypothetical protein
MDDGGKVSSGLKLATNNFSKEEVSLLCHILIKKYNIKASIQSASNKKGNQYCIYISKHSIEHLNLLIKEFIHPSMKYKLNINP